MAHWQQSVAQSAIVLALMLSWSAPAAHGHGVRWTLDNGTGVIVLAFTYSGGSPMAFATTTVTGPDGLVHQRGKTDRSGRVAFVPSLAGTWHIVASDGMGHRSAAVIPVVRDAVVLQPTVTAGSDTPLPPAVAVVLGLSLIGNLLHVADVWRRRSRRTTASSDGGRAVSKH